MKTTIDIASNILESSRAAARQDHITLRELVEQGLELALAQRDARGRKAVQPVIFRGQGLSRAYREASWRQIRDAAYQGRGA